MVDPNASNPKDPIKIDGKTYHTEFDDTTKSVKVLMDGHVYMEIELESKKPFVLTAEKAQKFATQILKYEQELVKAGKGDLKDRSIIHLKKDGGYLEQAAKETISHKESSYEADNPLRESAKKLHIIELRIFEILFDEPVGAPNLKIQNFIDETPPAEDKSDNESVISEADTENLSVDAEEDDEFEVGAEKASETSKDEFEVEAEETPRSSPSPEPPPETPPKPEETPRENPEITARRAAAKDKLAENKTKIAALQAKLKGLQEEIAQEQRTMGDKSGLKDFFKPRLKDIEKQKEAIADDRHKAYRKGENSKLGKEETRLQAKGEEFCEKVTELEQKQKAFSKKLATLAQFTEPEPGELESEEEIDAFEQQLKELDTAIETDEEAIKVADTDLEGLKAQPVIEAIETGIVESTFEGWLENEQELVIDKPEELKWNAQCKEKYEDFVTNHYKQTKSAGETAAPQFIEDAQIGDEKLRKDATARKAHLEKQVKNIKKIRKEIIKLRNSTKEFSKEIKELMDAGDVSGLKEKIQEKLANIEGPQRAKLKALEKRCQSWELADKHKDDLRALAKKEVFRNQRIAKNKMPALFKEKFPHKAFLEDPKAFVKEKNTLGAQQALAEIKNKLEKLLQEFDTSFDPEGRLRALEEEKHALILEFLEQAIPKESRSYKGISSASPESFRAQNSLQAEAAPKLSVTKKSIKTEPHLSLKDHKEMSYKELKEAIEHPSISAEQRQSLLFHAQNKAFKDSLDPDFKDMLNLKNLCKLLEKHAPSCEAKTLCLLAVSWKLAEAEGVAKLIQKSGKNLQPAQQKAVLKGILEQQALQMQDPKAKELLAALKEDESPKATPADIKNFFAQLLPAKNMLFDALDFLKEETATRNDTNALNMEKLPGYLQIGVQGNCLILSPDGRLFKAPEPFDAAKREGAPLEAAKRDYCFEKLLTVPDPQYMKHLAAGLGLVDSSHKLLCAFEDKALQLEQLNSLLQDEDIQSFLYHDGMKKVLEERVFQDSVIEDAKEEAKLAFLNHLATLCPEELKRPCDAQLFAYLCRISQKFAQESGAKSPLIDKWTDFVEEQKNVPQELQEASVQIRAEELLELASRNADDAKDIGRRMQIQRSLSLFSRFQGNLSNYQQELITRANVAFFHKEEGIVSEVKSILEQEYTKEKVDESDEKVLLLKPFLDHLNGNNRGYTKAAMDLLKSQEWMPSNQGRFLHATIGRTQEYILDALTGDCFLNGEQITAPNHRLYEDSVFKQAFGDLRMPIDAAKLASNQEDSFEHLKSKNGVYQFVLPKREVKEPLKIFKTGEGDDKAWQFVADTTSLAPTIQTLMKEEGLRAWVNKEKELSLCDELGNERARVSAGTLKRTSDKKELATLPQNVKDAIAKFTEKEARCWKDAKTCLIEIKDAGIFLEKKDSNWQLDDDHQLMSNSHVQKDLEKKLPALDGKYLAFKHQSIKGQLKLLKLVDGEIYAFKVLPNGDIKAESKEAALFMAKDCLKTDTFGTEAHAFLDFAKEELKQKDCALLEELLKTAKDGAALKLQIRLAAFYRKGCIAAAKPYKAEFFEPLLEKLSGRPSSLAEEIDELLREQISDETRQKFEETPSLGLSTAAPRADLLQMEKTLLGKLKEELKEELSFDEQISEPKEKERVKDLLPKMSDKQALAFADKKAAIEASADKKDASYDIKDLSKIKSDIKERIEALDKAVEIASGQLIDFSHELRARGIDKSSEDLILDLLQTKLALEGADKTRLENLSLRYFKAHTELQHLKNCQRALEKYEKSSNNAATKEGLIKALMTKRGYDLEAVLDETQIGTEAFEKKRLDILSLLFIEYNNGYRLRPEQAKDYQLILEGKKSIAQFLTGEGKSDALTPLLILRLADGKNLLRLLVPKALVNSNLLELNEKFKDKMQNRMKHFVFDIHQRNNKAYLKELLEDLIAAKKNAHGVISSTESFGQPISAAIKMLLVHADKAGNKECLQILCAIKEELKNAKRIEDEAHIVGDPDIEFNMTGTKKSSINSLKVLFAGDIFRALKDTAIPYQSLEQFHENTKAKVLDLIMKSNTDLKGKLETAKKALGEADFKKFALARNAASCPDIDLGKLVEEEKISEETADALAFLNKALNVYLPNSYWSNHRVGIEHGRGDGRLYSTSLEFGRKKERSQAKDPIVTVFDTFLMNESLALDEEHLIAFGNALLDDQNLLNESLNHDNKAIKAFATAVNALKEKAPGLSTFEKKHFFHKNLDNKALGEAFTALGKDKEARIFLSERVVLLRELKVAEEEYQVTRAGDILSKSCIKFSATPNPFAFNAEDSQAEKDDKIHVNEDSDYAWMLRVKERFVAKPSILEPKKEGAERTKEYIAQVVKNGGATAQAFVDGAHLLEGMGNREIAAQFQTALKTNSMGDKDIVYFDTEKKAWSILKSDKSVVPFLKADFENASDETKKKYYIFYDEANTTGADTTCIQLANARFVNSLGPAMNYSKLQQAVGRARLKDSQEILLMMSKPYEAELKKEWGKKDGEALSSKELVCQMQCNSYQKDQQTLYNTFEMQISEELAEAAEEVLLAHHNAQTPIDEERVKKLQAYLVSGGEETCLYKKYGRLSQSLEGQELKDHLNTRLADFKAELKKIYGQTMPEKLQEREGRLEAFTKAREEKIKGPVTVKSDKKAAVEQSINASMEAMQDQETESQSQQESTTEAERTAESELKFTSDEKPNIQPLRSDEELKDLAFQGIDPDVLEKLRTEQLDALEVICPKDPPAFENDTQFKTFQTLCIQMTNVRFSKYWLQAATKKGTPTLKQSGYHYRPQAFVIEKDEQYFVLTGQEAEALGRDTEFINLKEDQNLNALKTFLGIAEEEELEETKNTLISHAETELQENAAKDVYELEGCYLGDADKTLVFSATIQKTQQGPKLTLQCGEDKLEIKSEQAEDPQVEDTEYTKAVNKTELQNKVVTSILEASKRQFDAYQKLQKAASEVNTQESQDQIAKLEQTVAEKGQIIEDTKAALKDQSKTDAQDAWFTSQKTCFERIKAEQKKMCKDQIQACSEKLLAVDQKVAALQRRNLSGIGGEMTANDLKRRKAAIRKRLEEERKQYRDSFVKEHEYLFDLLHSTINAQFIRELKKLKEEMNNIAGAIKNPFEATADGSRALFATLFDKKMELETFDKRKKLEELKKKIKKREGQRQVKHFGSNKMEDIAPLEAIEMIDLIGEAFDVKQQLMGRKKRDCITILRKAKEILEKIECNYTNEQREQSQIIAYLATVIKNLEKEISLKDGNFIDNIETLIDMNVEALLILDRSNFKEEDKLYIKELIKLIGKLKKGATVKVNKKEFSLVPEGLNVCFLNPAEYGRETLYPTNVTIQKLQKMHDMYNIFSTIFGGLRQDITKLIFTIYDKVKKMQEGSMEGVDFGNYIKFETIYSIFLEEFEKSNNSTEVLEKTLERVENIIIDSLRSKFKDNYFSQLKQQGYNETDIKETKEFIEAAIQDENYWETFIDKKMDEGYAFENETMKNTPRNNLLEEINLENFGEMFEHLEKTAILRGNTNEIKGLWNMHLERAKQNTLRQMKEENADAEEQQNVFLGQYLEEIQSKPAANLVEAFMQGKSEDALALEYVKKHADDIARRQNLEPKNKGIKREELQEALVDFLENDTLVKLKNLKKQIVVEAEVKDTHSAIAPLIDEKKRASLNLEKERAKLKGLEALRQQKLREISDFLKRPCEVDLREIDADLVWGDSKGALAENLLKVSGEHVEALEAKDIKEQVQSVLEQHQSKWMEAYNTALGRPLDAIYESDFTSCIHQMGTTKYQIDGASIGFSKLAQQVGGELHSQAETIIRKKREEMRKIADVRSLKLETMQEEALQKLNTILKQVVRDIKLEQAEIVKAKEIAQSCYRDSAKTGPSPTATALQSHITIRKNASQNGFSSEPS